MKPLHRLPAYAVNGAAVACGVALVHFGVGAASDASAAQIAVSGAVCASLADLPNPPSRTVYRVSASALASLAATAVVAAVASQPLALGVAIAVIAFAAMMTAAWGRRAAAMSFAPILAVVFAMAPPPGRDAPALIAAWFAVGAAIYFGWSLATAALLRPRWRRLAIADAVAAMAQLLRARSTLLVGARDAPRDATIGGRDDAATADAFSDWIAGEADVADRLQQARNFAFADAGKTPRDAAILLRLIDLRDLLLATRLDLDRVGDDAAGGWLLTRTAAGLTDIACALDAIADALRTGRRRPWQPIDLQTERRFEHPPMADDDPRRRVLPSLIARLRTLGETVDGLGALLQGSPGELQLTPAQLARFVAPEGWPLHALVAEMGPRSPIARHAVRSALALGCAYAIGEMLPWASHPNWLVLSVAVVLRGSLEQTLGRRNERIGGTLVGCVAVVAFAALHAQPLLTVAIVVAVGIAHAYSSERYWIAAAAWTVMALLQSYAADPGAGFAVAERAADTVLGALLAWAFSYVLPSWERQQVPKAIRGALSAITDYAGRALQWPPPDDAGAVERRLARRRAYDALESLAGAVRRTGAEPRRVRMPTAPVGALLDHAQRLLADLSMVRLILHRAASRLDGAATATMLRRTTEQLHDAAAGASAPPPDEADAVGPGQLPSSAFDDDPLPWLQRRLDGVVDDARRIRAAADDALRIPGRS